MNIPFPKSWAAFSDVKFCINHSGMIVAFLNPVNLVSLGFPCFTYCSSFTGCLHPAPSCLSFLPGLQLLCSFIPGSFKRLICS